VVQACFVGLLALVLSTLTCFLSQGLVADASEGTTHISQTQEEAFQAELAGRTGETDSESEQA
jgi:hypothetical protein